MSQQLQINCAQCGAQNHPDVNFCRNCGAQIRQTADIQPSVPATPPSPPHTPLVQPANQAASYPAVSPPGQMAQYGGHQFAAPGQYGAQAIAASTPAAGFIRWAGYIIDVFVTILFVFLSFIPFIGILFAVFGMLYWLLRDINGASVGKSVVGIRVVNVQGLTPDRQSLIMRNITFALPWAFGIVPFIGHFLMGIAAILIGPTEHLFVLFTGRRIGDRIAGTYSGFQMRAPCQ